MSKINRDIGFIYPKSNQPLAIPQSEVEVVKKTQTYLATHDGEDKVLPYRLRSFISFTFGGKRIEDFGIIRVTGGDRINQPIYTSFQDLVSQYEVLDGQFYWGTHHKPLELNYTLSTDYMTQRQLDQFKAWFAPGKQRQLIRAEHSNRAILARVRQAPTMNMLPFQGEEQIVMAQTRLKVPTTVYKGDITISFIADNPFWYSLCNMLGRRYAIVDNSDQPIPAEEYTIDEHFLYYEFRWYNANGELVETFTDKDALKIIAQDNIPTANMIRIFSRLFLGDNNVVLDYQQTPNQDYSYSAVVAPEGYDGPNENMYAHVNYARVGKYYAPTVNVRSLENSGVSLMDGGQLAYLYYAGNAPSYPIIRFTLHPIISSVAPYYIINPGNQYGNKLDSSNSLYNTITIQSQKKHIFKFTTPSAWNGYNQAMSIFKELSEKQNGNGTALTQVKQKIRDGVNHNDARAWAIQIVNRFESVGIKSLVSKSNLQVDEIQVESFYSCMRCFITSVEPSISVSSVIILGAYEGNFIFNAKNGEAIGKIEYKVLPNSIENNSSITIDELNKSTVVGNILQEFNLYQTAIKEQKVGDMVRSSYLFLEETNHPNQEGLIIPWSEENKNLSHKIYTDYPAIGRMLVLGEQEVPIYGLTNFSIQYKNMYL